MSYKIIAINKKAYRDYEIIRTWEVGIVLKGSEVKSIKNNKISLQEGWVDVVDNQTWLKNVNIAHYTEANIFNHEPKADRKLLLHKKEIIKLYEGIQEKGYTAIPLKVYLKNRLIKFEIALAKGRKTYDKREYEKKRQAQIDIYRELKNNKR